MTQSKTFSQTERTLLRALGRAPSAVAQLKGSEEYPSIEGRVSFYQTERGVLVLAQVYGLPHTDAACREPFYAFHIHSGSSCTGDESDPFKNALTHYDPERCPHPAHAGDLLPLLGNHGFAFELFLSDRFTVDEVIGKTVIVHLDPDDFTTQPAGNAGKKIACGQIERVRSCGC